MAIFASLDHVSHGHNIEEASEGKEARAVSSPN
jgi:hypothetical protein